MESELVSVFMTRMTALDRVDEIMEALDERLPPLPTRTDIERFRLLVDEANDLLDALSRLH